MSRSYLFIPANRPGMMQSAACFAADAVIFDLEDAVAMSEKDGARILLQEFLKANTFDYEVVIRINSLDHNDGILDLETVVGPRVDAIMLPKAGAENVQKLASLLANFEKARKINKEIAIIPLVETAIGVLEVEVIARLERVKGILLGAEDLTSDMEIERTKTGEEITYPRARVAFACHAAKIEAIDTPFTDVNDDEGLFADALRARKLGMTAKSAIHPNQISVINEVYAPSEKQIVQAQRILEAASKQQGVFSLDGKMIDKPIIDRSQKIISKAKRYDLL
jgi:citrate lyase subunit beta/citryl-CoA lyase